MTDSQTARTVSGAGIAAKALEVAALMQGKPYIWNGKTLDGFDCSGFVSYVLMNLLPNLGPSLQMDVAGYRTSALFEDVTDPRPGDIIIFPGSNSESNHIGIVCSSDRWVGSQSGGVAVVKFNNVYWSRRTKFFRRLRQISSVSIREVFQSKLLV